MPYASDRDRDPHDLELTNPAFPVAPLNIFLTSPGEVGVFDLSWDSPATLAANSGFQLCGVNIYRSFDSEFGPFERITTLPCCTTFFRDRTDNVLVVDETVDDSQWLIRGECTGDDPSPRYVFKTLHHPIVQSASQAVPEHNINQVWVTIDGVPARLRKVIGETGEVELETSVFSEVGTQSKDPSPVPSADSVVKVTYRYNRTLIKTVLATRIFYRITTVGVRLPAQTLVETPLERAVATTNREIEKLDWIWREAVRRNRWILQEGGERVQLFIRKTVGLPCTCLELSTSPQPQSDCLHCYGVGIVGGYEGPYDIVIAPDDAERRLAQRDIGRQQEHVYEVWTGPSPLLSQRDFLVKINNERYSIGPVRMPTNRGMLLQQHFNIGYFNEKDIRYKVPLDRVQGSEYVRPQIPPHLEGALQTSKPNIPDERELRGTTLTYENITY